MYIVHIASELAPFAKVGGLADVTQGLSKALFKMGEKTTVILPKYRAISESLIPSNVTKTSFRTFYKNQWHNNLAWSFSFEGGNLVLIEPISLPFFQEEEIYSPDDWEKFLYFSRASLEYLAQSKQTVNVLHLHDWHVAICPFLMNTIFWNYPLKISTYILTIHNLMYQGKVKRQALLDIGFFEKELDNNPYLLDPVKKNLYNLLRIGIEYADHVVAVSPNYAQEILTVEKGCGLHEVLIPHKSKISGILNGLDEEFWDPSKDPLIPYKFSANDPLEVSLKQKNLNKLALQKKVKLHQKETFLVIIICRLVEQKGLELLAHGIKTTLQKGGQVLLLGTGASTKDQKMFDQLEKDLSAQEAHFHYQYNEALSRLAYAAADFILIPSRFEPCGLTQFIGMRYGVLPIVRKTGGLADTVFDADDKRVLEERKNGYVFSHYDKEELDKTLQRAFTMWLHHKKKKKRLIKQALSYNSSWEKATKDYLQLYKEALEKTTALEESS